MAVKQCILLYGDSGEGKSSLVGTAINWLHQKTGLRTRIYTADGGQGTLQWAIDAGLAEAWHLREHVHPFETINFAVRGYWPDDLLSPTSKLFAPSIKDAAGNVLHNPKNDLSKIGLIVFEGLTAFADILMNNMSERSARGEKMGSEVAIKFQDNTVYVAGSTQNSYDITQRRLLDGVNVSQSLPVPYLIWTALRDRAEDAMSGLKIFGPKVAGHAATATIPKAFGPTLCVILWPTPDNKGERRVYWTRFFGVEGREAGIAHYANSRIPPFTLRGLPEYYTYKADDLTLLGRMIETIEERQAEAAKVSAGRLDAKATPQTS